MDDLKLQIVYRATDEIMPYVNNAKIHGDEDVDAIMESIKAFGFNDPIGIWHGIIVEGHGRLLAAKRLGMETVPTVSLDHLTDEQRKAYALAHNKTTELSQWNFNILDAELAEIGNFDMSLFGFDEAVIDEFGNDFSLPNGEKSEICTMTFTVHEKQKELIERALNSVEPLETYGNTNKVGNCLYEVVKEWEEQRR